jgi:glycosyltransferase involved in cell wall biosynthesis
MRLAFVTETYPPELNGAAMSVGRMVHGLRARGHEIELIRPRQSSEQACANLDEYRTPGLPIPMYRELRIGLPMVRTLATRWLERPPDMVHVATEGPLGWAAMRAARIAGLPVTSDFRTDFERYCSHYGWGWFSQIVAGYLRHFHKRTDCTFVPTRQLQARLQSQGYQRVEVVGRGVDTQLYTPARRDPELRRRWGVVAEDPVVLYVGRLAPEKNLPLALRAYAAMKARDARARLVVVGDGPQQRRLRREVPDAVFAGSHSGERLAAHYASADIFLFPSLTETFGNVTLEALASGLAVVAFRAGAAEVHIRDCVNGVLATPGDEQDFIACACAVMKQMSRLAPLRTAARQTAKAVSWSAIVEQFESRLMEVARAGQVSLTEQVPA